MTVYRTRTYIAADWSSDKDAVDQLRKWNDSDHWSLSFTDAHELTQANDDSLNCSIKKSLRERMNASKTFVLIVGNKTKSLRSGSCAYCESYNSYSGHCARGQTVDFKSYIEFECQLAINAGIKIVVLYKSETVNRDKCPELIRYEGVHARMWKREGNKLYWDYQSVKKAMDA